jgi:NADH-quinone oxidoreductase subunit E
MIAAATIKGSRQFDAACVILDRFGRHPARLVPILQALQEEYRYLPGELLAYVAIELGVPPARVYGVATRTPTGCKLAWDFFITMSK